VSKRVERREKIVFALDQFRQAVGRALGVAVRDREAATEHHARTMAELWLREHGIDRAERDPAHQSVLTNPRMADIRERLEADRKKHFDEWTHFGPIRLTELVLRAAPGAAGEPWPTWLGEPGTADGSTVPELWRIGTAVSDSAPDPDPFPVAVPLLDSAHLQVSTTSESFAAAEAMVETLLLRTLSYFLPGLVHVHVWDTGQLTNPLPGLYPLTRAGLLTVHDPTRPRDMLDELSEHIRRVHSGVLAGGHTSVQSISGRSGRRTEPWRIAVLFGQRDKNLPDDQLQQLQRIARNGLSCGVQLIAVDVRMSVNSPMETVTFFDAHHARTSMTGSNATFTPDPPLPRTEVPGACAGIAEGFEQRKSRLGRFADLLPPHQWTARSDTGLSTPVGFHEGVPVDVVLGDSSPHALIAGPSGSGKTNFLYALLGGLSARYSPDELELYLLDFKEGVSFAQFTPGRKDPTWLPHARLVGVNVNADREFGVALLRFLSHTMRDRADAAKQHEVTKLEELRAEDPTGRWPRIVAVIDEFQYLFAERDPVAAEAVQLLEDVARRGRSQGIHLVLASQDVSGIEAFWGKPAIFEQFVLRVALPKARRVLTDTNDAAVELPRWHAVINHESGVRQGNLTARIPDATARGTFDELQRTLWERRPAELSPPQLFDGGHVPALVDAADFRALRAGAEPPVALFGQVIDVAGSAAGSAMVSAPGRNVAVISSSVDDAATVLGAAALSLAAQHEPGTAVFALCALVADSTGPVEAMAARLRADGHTVDVVERDGFREFLAGLATDLAALRSGAPETKPLPRYVFGYGIDAVHSGLEAREPGVPVSGLDQLREVLRYGPPERIHLLGWWRGVGRLRASLPLASVEDIGPWVAFDVQGQELNPLAPGQHIAWSPRAGRGLFFDRFAHARPQVIIPFGLEEKP
jgi:hypothetical protein